MLPRLRLLQVGDVHLPSAVHSYRSVDDKDARFPPDIKGIISEQPLKKAFEKIYEMISASEVAGLLFMGDLTNLGQLSGYQACARYLANALQIGSHGELNKLAVGIVPGNHDIDRLLAKLPSNVAKFTPLTAALTEAGLPVIPIKEPLWLRLQSSDASALVAMLNSCWGCGSPEFIPEEFREDVQAAIDKAIERGRTKREISAYYERQLDTPAFASEAIQQLMEDTRTRQSNALIVVAHHNLLPQRLPRLAPYTELVNSGALRSLLQELGKPVIYLHGHIHQDPIEILQIPGGFPLVTIAAPEITHGFNIIELVFTRGGIPLSCRVLKWRFDQAGYIRPSAPATISLIAQRRRSQRTSLSELYRIILAAREIYWHDLRKAAAKHYQTEADLKEDLELLESDGRVSIENYEMTATNWIIGARI